MYIVVMPNVTIYVSDSLRQALRDADIPISETCQQALWARLAADRDRRAAAPIRGQLQFNHQEAK